MLAGSLQMQPLLVVIRLPASEELEIKLRVEIRQLIQLPGIVYRRVPTDKAALLQLRQPAGQSATVRQRCFLHNLVSRQSLPLAGQHTHNLHVPTTVRKKRTVQILKLIAQRGILPEEHPVHVLRQTHAAVYLLQVVWDAPHHHIALCKHLFRPSHSAALQVLARLAQRERHQVNLAGNSVMQPSLVLDDVLHHPRCGRPAHHQHHILARGAPLVPEQVYSLHKTRLLRIHPRQFVQENHLALLARLLHHHPQPFESLIPVSRSRRLAFVAILQQRIMEVLQLLSLCSPAHACSVEHKVVPKELLHQKSLAHTPATIHRHELRSARF